MYRFFLFLLRRNKKPREFWFTVSGSPEFIYKSEENDSLLSESSNGFARGRRRGVSHRRIRMKTELYIRRDKEREFAKRSEGETLSRVYVGNVDGTE